VLPTGHRETAHHEPVSTVATRVVAEIDARRSLRTVAEHLVADEVGLLLVRGPGRAPGVVSERDVVAVLAAGGDPAATRAAEAMTTDLVTAPLDASVADVGRRMLDAGIRHVVLVDGGPGDGDEVVGVVSIRDVLRALLADDRDPPDAPA
jgi:CBS domain-containing protein